MAKYKSIQNQNSALRQIAEFDINRIQNAMRLNDPLEGYKFGLDVENISESITYIGNTMVVDGDISSSDAIAVKGTVKGNISTKSDIGVSGLVNGNISADNINYEHAAVKGNTKAVKDVMVSEDSVLIGDVEGGNLIVAGKIKGSVNANTKVLFKPTSLVVGQITAANFNMEDGARLNGNIVITSSDINVIDDSEFDLEV